MRQKENGEGERLGYGGFGVVVHSVDLSFNAVAHAVDLSFDLGPATIRHGHILLRKEVGTEPMEMKGGLWETYVPDSEHDTRVFERDIRTGRVVQTCS